MSAPWGFRPCTSDIFRECSKILASHQPSLARSQNYRFPPIHRFLVRFGIILATSTLPSPRKFSSREILCHKLFHEGPDWAFVLDNPCVVFVGPGLPSMETSSSHAWAETIASSRFVLAAKTWTWTQLDDRSPYQHLHGGWSRLLIWIH